MRHLVGEIGNRLVSEIRIRAEDGWKTEMHEERGRPGGRLQFVGRLQLGWESYKDYCLHRTSDHLMIAITNPSTKSDRYLVAYFGPEPEDRKLDHPRLMHKFVRAGAQAVLMLNGKIDETAIREQILLHFIHWSWDANGELADQFCKDLHIPFRYVAKLGDRMWVIELRKSVAAKLIQYWADPSVTSTSYFAYKKFCIEQVFRESPELLKLPAKPEKANENDEYHDLEKDPIVKSRKNLENAAQNARIIQEGLGVQESANLLGVSVKTIYKWVRDEKLHKAEGFQPIHILASELPVAMKLARDADARMKKKGDLSPIIQALARQDGISPRSARRKIERWRKTEVGQAKLRNLVKMINTGNQ
jgi:hypothetical protein